MVFGFLNTLQERTRQFQQTIQEIRVTASGRGIVTVTVDGAGKLVDLQFDSTEPTILPDRALLRQAVLEAYALASGEASRRAEAVLQEFTGEIGVPGLKRFLAMTAGGE